MARLVERSSFNHSASYGGIATKFKHIAHIVKQLVCICVCVTPKYFNQINSVR